jgi:hypothetical protein
MHFVVAFIALEINCGGESGLVAGLDFKSSCGSPEGGLGGFDSHAPPPIAADAQEACGFFYHFLGH